MVSWFPSRHPDQVRIAQSVATVQQLGSNTGFIICMMALGLTVQFQHGFGWLAAAWQCAMGALGFAAFNSWSRLSGLPPPERVSVRHIRDVVLSSGLGGTIWSVGLVAWASQADQQLALMAVAVSMTFTVHAVASGYFVPWSVVAFSAPVIAASIFVLFYALDAPVANIGVLLIAFHSLASFRQLKKNWNKFSHAIDIDVERNRLAAMLQEQKEIAERAVQVKTRFLASASHDLRQPMHAISLYLDGLAEVELPPRVREVISDARVCAHDMNDMFRSLLDISRLDARQAVPALSTFSVASLLSRIEKEFQPLAAARGIRLKVRHCSDHVYSDPVMVERIALNFVSNAVRHTSKGGVLVGCRLRGPMLRFTVYDTAGGIPESEQESIFEEFHRLDSAPPSDNTGGVGLGLAIVRRLAQALRLNLVMRSTPGRGSMFAVDMPLVHVARGQAAVGVPERRLAGRLVVVVDDEPSILSAASFILESAGCDVVCARSGVEAMQSLAGSLRPPDVIICDYELSQASKGSDVIRELRQEFNSDIPALLVTGNTAGGMAEKSAKGLGVPVMYKPLEASALKGSLEQLLQPRGAMT
ncbi:MAG TPA: hybrid sensor histidine kinase/response regulator [Ramlibacter sp.]|uniref:ATP-binding response regulator n=1 Tax=Ramlibacter sp. TaxID=1917967 RepID=UPI002B580A9C|nr:hybrid sensor histidine kinase/response regulator [Ramlibacter sp.]HVZ44812.1 hybrid sensor histidine kinase/response regulator [Ramlibacter sp.]